MMDVEVKPVPTNDIDIIKLAIDTMLNDNGNKNLILMK